MTDTLSFCGREEAITRMNCFGSEGRPFFFLIDYIAEKCLVEEPHRLPSSELDRKSTRLNSSHAELSRMPSSA